MCPLRKRPEMILAETPNMQINNWYQVSNE